MRRTDFFLGGTKIGCFGLGSKAYVEKVNVLVLSPVKVLSFWSFWLSEQEEEESQLPKASSSSSKPSSSSSSSSSDRKARETVENLKRRQRAPNASECKAGFGGATLLVLLASWLTFSSWKISEDFWVFLSFQMRATEKPRKNHEKVTSKNVTSNEKSSEKNSYSIERLQKLVQNRTNIGENWLLVAH